jgi:hypothetical protein
VTRSVWILVPALALAAPAARADGPLKETTVGMTGRLTDVVLPGPELEAKPDDDRKRPLLVREVTVYPHGSLFRYDIAYEGRDPGTYNLCDYLRRKDGTPTTGLPPRLVKVNAVRPPGQVEPNKLEIERGPRVGGYWLAVYAAGAVWVLGVVALVASFFFPRRKQTTAARARPPSLADRLRPLVEGAVAGTLSHAELANLERVLLAFWRKRLGLEAADPAEAIAALRVHPEAGPLLAKLEEWLHRPGPPAAVDVPALLTPYRELPPDALE